MTKKTKFEIGNQVRIDNGDDSTIYQITKLLSGCGCLIREIGKVDGQPHAEQRWDTSMLKHAVTDEMLKAFSFGPLKAGR